MVEQLHSHIENFCVVVLALYKGFTSDIIDSINFWRVELNMVSAATRHVNTTSFHSFNQLFVINSQLYSLVDGTSSRPQHLIEFLGLRHCTGETIE